MPLCLSRKSRCKRLASARASRAVLACARMRTNVFWRAIKKFLTRRLDARRGEEESAAAAAASPASRHNESGVDPGSPLSEAKPVERQVEARSSDDALASMVRCLCFTNSFILHSECPSLPCAGTWVLRNPWKHCFRGFKPSIDAQLQTKRPLVPTLLFREPAGSSAALPYECRRQEKYLGCWSNETRLQ